MRKSYVLILFCLVFLSQGARLHGQSMKAFLVAAEEAFEKKDYGAALKYYLTATEFDLDRTDLVYRSAESARHYNAFNLAEDRYQNVYDAEQDGEYPLAAFWLADIKQKLGKYDEAKRLYEVYLSEHEGDNEYFTARAKKEVEACAWARELLDNPSENIEINHLGGDINTGFTEFGALEKDSLLYFSSMRFEKEEDDYIPNRIITKVLKSEDRMVSTEIDPDFNSNQLNTAHLTFSRDGSRVYYTLCDYVAETRIRCDLYSRTVNDDGTFGEAVLLPDFINDPSASNTQPNIGYSNKTKQEVLFFVSDREGGKGNFDIYYTVIDQKGNFTKPMNLESINTVEDDITPFYHTNSDMLYFSSEGYQGMGGFDIYASPFDGDRFGTPVHQGVPLNSSYHDIYYSITDDGNKAYLSSNREGSMFLDPEFEACCYDIYEVNIKGLEIDLLAQAYNELTKEALLGAKITLVDASSKLVLGTEMNAASNEAKFKLENNRSYYLIAEKPDFYPDTVYFNTFNVKKSGTITKKLFLEPTPLQLEVLTFDRITRFPLNGVRITLKNLSDDSVEDITVVNEDGNEFNFDLIRGANYKIIAEKEDYGTVEIEMTTANVKGPKITRRIYMSDLLNTHLPLALYFDNDRPDRRTMRLTTEKSYSDTYGPYYAQKNEYIDNFIEGLPEEEALVPKQRMNDFFEYFLRGGKEKLDDFLHTLLTVLNQGHTLEIRLKGFSSPRASSKYNLALGQRRVHSVKNEIYRYKNGALQPFIDEGKLIITEISYGESLSPENVSDAIHDLRNSVYGLEASKQRKVEIIRVDVDKN
jgi:outer membrane protein OmpA-like peptidoglycan-associated protein